VKKKGLRSYLAKALLLMIVLALIQFFFNPLGLGLEPASVLGPDFFKSTVKNMTDVELLIDGKEAFDVVFQDLDSAQESIYIQTYIWKDDKTGQSVVERVRKAADRGVDVVINKDLLGTVFELGDMLQGRPSPVFTSAGLKSYPGIKVNTKLFAHNDHSKYFIVDHETLIFGGMNIADEYHFQWHDYMGLIRGKGRITLFENRVLQGKPWPGHLPAVVAVNDEHATEIRTALREMIDHAQQRVVVQHAYFSDNIIIEALLRAAAREVNVDVILPKDPDTHGHANMVTINRLLASKHKNHIRVFLYPVMSHAKVVLTDRVIVGLGSANLTPRSMLTSKELTLFAHGKPDAPFLQKLREQMDADLAKSTEVRESFKLTILDRIMAVVGKYVW
jgi:cardiolipin synthase A/B